MARRRAAPRPPETRLGALCALLGAASAAAAPRGGPRALAAGRWAALTCGSGRPAVGGRRPEALRRERRPAPGGRRAPPRRAGSGAAAGGAAAAHGYGQIRRQRGPVEELYGLWRVFWFGLLLFSSAFVLVAVCLPMLPYVKLRDPHKRSLFNKISIFWATTLCSMFFNVEVVNPENLPAKDDPRQYMYVANHQSFMDILSVFSLRRPFKFISKSEILWIPVVGFAMKRLGHITVTRKSQRSQVHMIRTCLFQLHKGCSVFFFPEGTRTKTGRLRNFKKGAFSIAKKAKVGVVPITVLGTGDIMPAGRELRLFPSRLGVKLIVHPTFTEEEVQKMTEADLRRKATDVVRSGLPVALRGGD